MASINGWSGKVVAHETTPDPRVVEHVMPAWNLTVDSWVLALATATLPAAWAWPRVRRTLLARRRRAGTCARCGYDLRATPGRCPECGAAAGPQP